MNESSNSAACFSAASYGDEPTTTTQNRVKFATYFRDEVSTLDYARNRYYSSTIARFTTADPYGPSARPGSPQTWNRYSYVGGDPVNFNDPAGLAPCGSVWRENETGLLLSDLLAQNWEFTLFAGVVWAEASADQLDQRAVAFSIFFRWQVVNGYIWMGRPSNRTVDGWEWANPQYLGWGSPGGLADILAGPGQYDTVEVVGGAPQLKNASGFNAAINSDADSAQCRRLRTAVGNALTTWLGEWEVWEVPFLGLGVVTSFNTSLVQSRPWEAFFGTMNSANVFYGIPNGNWTVPNTPGPPPSNVWRPKPAPPPRGRREFRPPPLP